MSDAIYSRMEYIQNVFLGVQNHMQGQSGLDKLMAFVEAEPPEYRSVAYESASMEIGLLDLSRGTGLHLWNELYRRAKAAHGYHLEIGLGWALAKKETPPDPTLASAEPLMRWMVLDGIGYYYGLFRGRRTVKQHEVPDCVKKEDLFGFDQGLGRRLWYIAKGDVDEVARLNRTFPETRQPALWRGTGIACGYVGGMKEAGLKHIAMMAGAYRSSLSDGIALAAGSRRASGSITIDVETACRVVCEMPLDDVINNLKPTFQS